MEPILINALESRGSDLSPSEGSRLYTYLICVIAAVGGFMFGYDLYIIASAIIYLRDFFHLTKSAEGFAVGSAFIGCAFGPLLGGWLADWAGRKKVLMCTALLFGLGALGTAVPNTIGTFNVFRIVGGLGVGLASVISPMYIAEIAPARIRGRLVTLNQFAIVCGCLISVVVAWSFSKCLAPDVSWRWMLGSCVVPVIILVFGLLFVPESPRWLVAKNRNEEALKILARVDGRKNAEIEVQNIMTTMGGETGRLVEVFRPGIRRALIIAIHLAVLSQLSGITALTFYAPSIFQEAGFRNASDAIQQGIYINLMNIVITALSLWLVERAGRRPLLLIGMPGMTLGMIALGLSQYYHWTGFPVVVLVLLCLSFYWIGLAPLSWLIMSEIFPNRIRSRAMALASVSVWISGFLMNQVFPLMQDFFARHFGNSAGTFWVFSLVCLYGFFFSLQMVPETRRKTLEEISQFWRRNDGN